MIIIKQLLVDKEIINIQPVHGCPSGVVLQKTPLPVDWIEFSSSEALRVLNRIFNKAYSIIRFILLQV